MATRAIITVVIPVFNAAPFLARCLDSVLGQNAAPFEVIAVDDGSTDGSGDICRKYAREDSRVRVFRTENLGPGAAKNLALDEAEGDFFAFLDADDYYEADALAILLGEQEQSGADFIRCENRIFLDSSYPPPEHASISVQGPPQGKMPRDSLIDIGYVGSMPRVRYWSPCGSSLVVADTVRRLRLRFNERMRQGEDSWFMLEMAKASATYHYSPRVVYNWRRHSYNSVTLNSLHPLERASCKFFFYARLREFMHGKWGSVLADQALAHNYASVFIEMLIFYGGCADENSDGRGLRSLTEAIEDSQLQAALPNYEPKDKAGREAKHFIQSGNAERLFESCRSHGKEIAAGWTDFTGLDFRKVVHADYSPSD